MEEPRLVAHVVLKQSQPVTSDELSQFLKQRLPDYMAPGNLRLLDALPLTPNGKIDRQALSTSDWSRSDQSIPFVAPRTPIEQQLAGIWSGVLSIDQIGIHDDFFELGGHSLLATQVLSRLRQALSINLPLYSLFELPTIAQLAKRIEAIRGVSPIPQQSIDDVTEDYLEGVL